jgi:hypothetical protein
VGAQEDKRYVGSARGGGLDVLCRKKGQARGRIIIHRCDCGESIVMVRKPDCDREHTQQGSTQM